MLFIFVYVCHTSILGAGHFVFVLPCFLLETMKAFWLSFFLSVFLSLSGVRWQWEFISSERREETSLTSFLSWGFIWGKRSVVIWAFDIFISLKEALRPVNSKLI